MNSATGQQNAAFPEDDPDPIEELLLTAYPNPERVGCPGTSIITAFGNRQISKTNQVRDHIWHCSPCYKEFKAARDARWRREEAQARQRKRIRLAAVVMAAALVIAGISLTLLKKGNSFKKQQELAAKSQHSDSAATLAQLDFVTFNLLDVGTDRADEQHPIDLPPVHRTIVEARIILPRFSGTGRYTILVLKPRRSETAIAEGSGDATGNDTVAEVKIRLNLTHAAPGTYRLATRREGDKAMYYYPLRIVD